MAEELTEVLMVQGEVRVMILAIPPVVRLLPILGLMLSLRRPRRFVLCVVVDGNKSRLRKKNNNRPSQRLSPSSPVNK